MEKRKEEDRQCQFDFGSILNKTFKEGHNETVTFDQRPEEIESAFHRHLGEESSSEMEDKT